MKRTVLALLFGAAWGQPATAADPIEGFWRVPSRAPVVYWVYIEPWGDILAGTLVQRRREVSADLRNFPELDAEPGDLMPVFARITPKDGVRYPAVIWTGDGFDDVVLTLKGDKLSHDGCDARTPACQPQTWTRAD